MTSQLTVPRVSVTVLGTPDWKAVYQPSITIDNTGGIPVGPVMVNLWEDGTMPWTVRMERVDARACRLDATTRYQDWQWWQLVGLVLLPFGVVPPTRDFLYIADLKNDTGLVVTRSAAAVARVRVPSWRWEYFCGARGAYAGALTALIMAPWAWWMAWVSIGLQILGASLLSSATSGTRDRYYRSVPDLARIRARLPRPPAEAPAAGRRLVEGTRNVHAIARSIHVGVDRYLTARAENDSSVAARQLSTARQSMGRLADEVVALEDRRRLALQWMTDHAAELDEALSEAAVAKARKPSAARGTRLGALGYPKVVVEQVEAAAQTLTVQAVEDVRFKSLDRMCRGAVHAHVLAARDLRLAERLEVAGAKDLKTELISRRIVE